ncbi:MAG: hypothetical protein IT352_17230 [Gemmatimonadales bacterium]|nr:hypothetical protein [Gemmatimonadales bacterium]
MSLENVKARTGLVLRTAIAALPGVGGPLANFFTEQSLEYLRADLEAWLCDVERRLAAFEGNGMLDTHQIDTALQRVRLSNFALRAMEVEPGAWRKNLALVYAMGIRTDAPEKSMRDELDRIVLALQPNGVVLLRHLRDTCTLRSGRQTGDTAASRARTTHAELVAELRWPMALLQASTGRLLALLLVRDEAIGTLDYVSALGPPTELGVELLRWLELSVDGDAAPDPSNGT